MLKTAAPPLLVLTGPTGSGKSVAAIEAAQSFRGVVINADSMQVYRDFRILTARPTPEQEAAAPHRLYGALSAEDPCSAGRWRAMALAEIAAADAAGALPIVVGGTGLYLKALIEGLAPTPPTPPEARAEAEATYQRVGGEAFRRALARLDPESAARWPASDRRRLVRAWEVVHVTGRPIGAWRRMSGEPALDRPILMIAIVPPREVLYPRLDRRFASMVEAGALREAEAAAALDPGLPAVKAVGAPPLIAHVRGEIDLTTAIERGRRDTRRYAKRQMTWLRHQRPPPPTTFAQFSESLDADFFSFIGRFLLTWAR